MPAHTNYPSLSDVSLPGTHWSRSVPSWSLVTPFTLCPSPGQLPPGTIITSCRVWAMRRPTVHIQCHLWQVSLLGRWFTSTLIQSLLANERAGMGGIIQSGGRDTGSGLTDILNVSKYNRPEVRTSGKLLHRYLVTGSMTALRIFTILKNMLDQLIVANIQNRFSKFSSFFDGFPVHVWVSGAGHSREQM